MSKACLAPQSRAFLPRRHTFVPTPDRLDLIADLELPPLLSTFAKLGSSPIVTAFRGSESHASSFTLLPTI